jgi:GPH family glycoside/pentoside/hexuronide:cation symporter
MTGVSLLFYAPVNILAKKLGKKKLIVIAFAIFAGTFMLTSFSGKLGIGGMANGFLIAVLAAIPMAILGILPQAIVADIAQADGIKTGENRQGMFFAARTFAMKLGQSVALLLFTSLTTSKTESSYRTSAVIAAIFCLGGAIVLSLYKEKKIQAVITENTDA